MACIFVTGGGGFVGARVLPRLTAKGHDVIALRREVPGNGGSVGPADGGTLGWVRGDLSEPEGWRDALQAADIVLHLAARTGKAARALHRRDNLELTERLIEECRRAGVGRFVFVSSIVAKCPDTSQYPYARAKAEVEMRVRESGLSFQILRPTLVLGAGSSNLGSLRTLACAPVIPVFGDGRTQIQPIDADDLAGLVAEAVDDPQFDGADLDLGGPEVTTTETLLQTIRGIALGNRGRVVHLPVGLLMTGLWSLESLIGAGALPITAGQLSLFRYDTVIEPNPLVEAARTRMRTIEQMLRSSLIR